MYKKLSVIVPVYKGEKYIRKNLLYFQNAFKEMCADEVEEIEIIAVIDGFIDSSFDEASQIKGVNTIGYKENRGKGYALSYGFSHSTGDIVTFIDGDGDFNPYQLSNFFPYLPNADMVIGCKRHPFSLISNYPLIRRVLSRLFYILSRLFLGTSLKDTQSGLKLFNRASLDILLPMMSIYGFGFDLELCFLAQKHGLKIIEAPICIEFNGSSTISRRSAFRMLVDMLKIRYRYSVKRYYQKKYQENFFSFFFKN